MKLVDNMILMYNPHNRVVVQTTEEFKNKWSALGFTEIKNNITFINMR